jgi:dephospho-CoA kinase
MTDERPPLHTLHGPRARSLVLGVLGGIASGKSAVAALLAGPGGVVIDADRLARDVLAQPEVEAEIGAAFGKEVLRPDGSIDRARLGARVFASPADRERLESFTHPRIRARIRAELDAARAASVPRIVLDVPLLLENDDRHHLAAECDALVFVDADERVRDARAVAERGWPVGEVARRERTQMPLSQKRARADHVIENRGSKRDLEREVERVLRSLR